MDNIRTDYFLGLPSGERQVRSKDIAGIMHCDFLDLSEIEIERKASSLLPEDFARKRWIVLVEKSEDEILTIAAKDAGYIYVLDELKNLFQDRYGFEFVLSDPKLILYAWDYIYGEGERKIKSSLSWEEYLRQKKTEEKEICNTELTENDINDLKSILGQLMKHSNKSTGQIWESLDVNTRILINEFNPEEDVENQNKQLIIEGLNKIIRSREFYKEEIFGYLVKDEKIQNLAEQGTDRLNSKQIKELNRFIMEAIFPFEIKKTVSNVETEATEKESKEEEIKLSGPIEDIVNNIIFEAISMEASDIHLEQQMEYLLVRFRIDGYLQEIKTIPKEDRNSVIARLKVMAGMDLARKKIPHGGRISIRRGGQDFDLRVSMVPACFGEDAVLRILRKSKVILDLDSLGFHSEELEKFKYLLSHPYGIIPVTGPTGSGKSTTLYTALNFLRRPDVKILTIEDPVEYQLDRVTQVQVNNLPRDDEKKLTFAKALKEFLRQDPDIIMVGEIRDQETAAISIQAALTGHLLLTTLHTNDSVGVIMRLEDMGIQPFLINASMVGALAQRLVRRLCPQCKKESAIPNEVRSKYEMYRIRTPDKFYSRGEGCKNCNNFGYKGRTGIYEVFTVSDEIRALIANRASKLELNKQAVSEGFRPLFVDGLNKMAEGLTTYEEVCKVAMG